MLPLKRGELQNPPTESAVTQRVMLASVRCDDLFACSCSQLIPTSYKTLQLDFDISQSKYKAVLWHSDVVIGVCATRLTGAYCQGNGKDREGITPEKLNGNFLQITDRYQLSNILRYGDVRKIVALHPFKSGQQLQFLRKSLDRRRERDSFQ